MKDTDKAEFLAGYTRVLTNSWSSTDYSESLTRNPKLVLAEAGLAVPESATVVVERAVAGDASLDTQIAKWDEGATTGIFTLYVPQTPMIDTAELSESDLEAVSAGDSYCCCCCPCCSCT
jgi:hypothetical protein